MGAECALNACVLVFALVHEHECSRKYVEGGAQFVKQWQDGDNRQFACLQYFL